MTGKRSKIVAYRRTSTDDQLLGIEAQDRRVRQIALERGCRIVREFTEHESGGDNDRPELAKALAHARGVDAYLVVAKLDRLSRDAAFLMAVYDSGVPVIFGDLPEVDGSAAGRLILQVMASIAEFERRRIGERTREALAALKARGVRLGRPANLTPEGRARGVARAARGRTERAAREMAHLAPMAASWRAAGATLAEIAGRLNAEGYVTRRGGAWRPEQVRRVLARAAGR